MRDSNVWRRHDPRQMAGAEALTDACRCQQVPLERPERTRPQKSQVKITWASLQQRPDRVLLITGGFWVPVKAASQ